MWGPGIGSVAQGDLTGSHAGCLGAVGGAGLLPATRGSVVTGEPGERMHGEAPAPAFISGTGCGEGPLVYGWALKTV